MRDKVAALTLGVRAGKREREATHMTLQDLGSIGELLAAAATVVTLVYLAIQIRSNTRAVKSAAAQSVHEAFATWYRMLAADAPLAQLVTNGLRDYASLSEGDKARFVATLKAFWAERGYLCGDEFRSHVENDLMKRTPHFLSRPMGAFPIGSRS